MLVGCVLTPALHHGAGGESLTHRVVSTHALCQPESSLGSEVTGHLGKVLG